MLTSAPFDADNIVSMEDARVQCRLMADDSYNDPSVVIARDLAIGFAEDYCGLSAQEREFQWPLDHFSASISLPIGPVTSVDEINYYDLDGDDIALSAADWRLTGDSILSASGTTWPVADGSPKGIRTVFTAGFSTAEEIPQAMRECMLLAITAYFEDRTNPDLSGAMRAANRLKPVL